MNESDEYNRRIILEVLPFMDINNLVWLANRVADELERRNNET